MDQHGNILVCENEQQMPGYVKKTLAHTDIKSAVLVGVREYELFHGFAVFDDSKERTWTPLQLNTLNVLVRLLSEFIKANRPQRRRDLPQKIRNEIADSSALVYVVDPDTCKVLYANKAICQEFGGASEGNTCYESFMNRQSMCDNCPLKAMRLTGAAIPVPIIREGRKYMMQASPFIWYGRKAVMITGTSANTFAMAANTIREIELNTTLNRYVFTLSAMFDQIFEIDYTKDTFRILIDKMNTTSDHSVQTDMTSVFELWKKHLDAEEQKSYEKFFNFHNIRAAFRSGKVPTMSCRIHFDDKDDAYISSTLLQLDSSRYLCCSNNITEQHRAVEMQQQLTALKARNEVSDKYRIVIDQIGLAVIDINHAANDMSVSEQFRAYAMNRDDFAKMLEEMREKKPVSSPHHAEMCLKLKMTDGSIHWVKAAGTYLYGQDGSLQRTVGTLRDINEKVIEHQELDRLRDRVNQVYAILPDGVCIYLVADQKKHLVFCSDRIWKMLGCTKEEADLTIANGTENRFMPDEIKIPEEQISQLKAGKPVVLQSIQLRRKDGMLFSVRAYCSMAESPDGNRYCYVILEELKDEKQIRFS